MAMGGRRFRLDATFYAERDRFYPGSVSFHSVNVNAHYITYKKDNVLRIRKIKKENQKNACFKMTDKVDQPEEATSPKEATGPESPETRAAAKAKAAETVELSSFSKLTSFLFGERKEPEEEAAALPVLAEAEEAIEQPPLPPRTRRLFSGAEPEMARGDFAVLGFWFVSCIIFTCGCQPIPWLTCGRKKKRDPLFYTGIVLISIGCLLVVCYFNRDTCRSDDRAVDRPLPDVGPADRAASGSQRV